MSVEIRVNQVPYKYFKQINVSKSIDDMSGHSTIVVSEPKDDLSIIKINDLINISLDGNSVLEGYQEKVTDTESDGSHDISFSVRDAVQDLIDSSVPSVLRIPTQYTDLIQIITAAISGLGIIGIQVINNRGNLTLPVDIDGIPIIKAAEMGTPCGQYLTECARMVSCIMNSDGQGNLLLRNFTNENKLKTMLIYQKNGKNNNILDASLDIDYSDRFYKVICWSNGNIAYYSQNPTNGLGMYTGSAIDTEARSGRILEFFPQAPLANNNLCAMRAQEEVNLRRARSFNYKVKVQGFSANGQLWDIGQLVRVQDDKRRVKGWLLIKAIEYEYTLDGGSITSMTLTYPDSYGVTLTNDASNNKDSNSVSMAVAYTPVPASEKWKQSTHPNKSIASQTTGQKR